VARKLDALGFSIGPQATFFPQQEFRRRRSEGAGGRPNIVDAIHNGITWINTLSQEQ
jgi:hypothetical protein